VKYELPREEQLRYIMFMLQDTERLSGNINSILNLARIESKLSEDESAPVDLVMAIRQFIANNRHLFHNAEICVQDTTIGPIIYPIISPLFDMLLMNILTNAIKYNASPIPRVNISFAREDRSLLIRFRDNGIGILKEERKQIFRKFYRGRSDARIPASGSGIGLYLVQQIARLHHGRITADSGGEDKGSVFTLILPCDKREGDKP
jgi:two-component system phosphate regulon sensor histidine kinase PhoR